MTATALRSARETTVDDCTARPCCAVVVVNYASHDLLEQNLSRLDAVENVMIVVVDNFAGESERSALGLLARRHGWHVVLSDRNVGFGSGVNLGVEWARAHGADQFLLLNPDATLEPEGLVRMSERVAADPMTMVAPTVRTPEGKTWFGGAVVNLATGAIRSAHAGDQLQADDVPWLTGACALMSRRLWERVGGFDERYFLYWEDVDLSYRVQCSGGALEVMPDVVAVHEQGGTQESLKSATKSDTYYYHMVRGRLLFAGQHLGTFGRLRWLANSPRYAWGVVLHGGRRQLLHSVHPVVVAGRGIRDGAVWWRSPQSRSSSGVTRRLTVLQSVPHPMPTTNPYNVMLASGLDHRADIDLRMFSWAEALFRHHHVFHAHWPEALITRRGPIKTLVRQGLFAALLLKWRVDGTVLVRTVHNLDLPTGISPLERFLLNCFERQTVGRIRLNSLTPVPQDGPAQTVLHGDYRSWYEGYPEPQSVPGRIAYFGMIRRYKGVVELVRAFRKTEDLEPGLTLVIAGKPSSLELVDQLRVTASSDPRISLTFEFLDTRQLVTHLGEAELVVFPHTDMHNSGSALAALSLNRPILMQDNAVNRMLREEVGRGWIYLYDGRISADDICEAIDGLHRDPPSGRPDLSARDWAQGVSLHVDLYRRSVEWKSNSRRGVGARWMSGTRTRRL